MDLKQIHELIKIINKSNIGEISIEDKDGKVTIKQKEEQVITMAAPPQQVYNVAAPVAAPVAVTPSPSAAPAAPATPAAPKPTDDSKLLTIKSPMIGTFYRKSAPGKPNFVEVGSEVEVGSVVCIIEAMKLFNEIESEVKGTIVKVLVEDSTPVEYDQPLFLVQPS
ncbi:acetyl-CoA carboxylase biotin carboxyl carrier protein [Hydrotalea sp.]|uniref:acetyl-CoA carboxylase biotin carboxyl carrier protein n=1 Tax=Hydrotalea sp. TaxID=2881279 RepID=UPI00262A7591|nr:acetyl-CoA carboxylase biotin carboxyl carrier protein [Hydrotalea sp.]